jgi:predicted transcriptional regulator
MNERTKQIQKLIEEGFSYGQVGRKLGISRQRVHQIVTGYSSERNKQFRHLDDECAVCGEDADQLHHLDGNSNNNRVNNLVTLCTVDHTLVHRGKIKITIKVKKV